MAVTKIRPNVFDRDEQVIGCHATRQLAEQLGLVALYKNTTRSDIILDLLKTHLLDESYNPTMIRSIAERAYKTWKKSLDESEAGDLFPDFRSRLVASLNRKKLARKFFNAIVAEVDRLYGKDPAIK